MDIVRASIRWNRHKLKRLFSVFIRLLLVPIKEQIKLTNTILSLKCRIEDYRSKKQSTQHILFKRINNITPDSIQWLKKIRLNSFFILIQTWKAKSHSTNLRLPLLKIGVRNHPLKMQILLKARWAPECFSFVDCFTCKENKQLVHRF